MIQFDKTMSLATLGSLALSLLFVSVPSARAAGNVFDGKTFSVDYGVSSSGTASFIPLSNAGVTGSPGVEVPAMSGWAIDTAGSALSLTWDKAADFMNFGSPPFIGFRISDTGNQLGDITGVSITNTAYTPSAYGNLVEGFTPSDVTFDANNIYVNLSTSMWHGTPMASMGDPFRDRIALAVEFQAAPIPEPKTYAMLLAGLGLIGVMVRRRGFANYSA